MSSHTNTLQHQMFELPAPLPRPVAVQVRELPQPAPAAAPAARELWAAVQLGAVNAVPDEMHGEAFPPALAALVKRAQAFTPRVAVESCDAVLLELAGSQRLFGGMPGLLKALREVFPRPLQLAVAPTPLAAVLLARAGRNCCVQSPARLAGRLAPLPLRHLHWGEEELARLHAMGIGTLAELLRLPRAGLARRIGPERLAQLDRLTGQRSDPRPGLAAPERFHERIDPDYETVDRERLLAGLAPTLTRLEDFLRARQRGVMALRLTLHYRRGISTECILRCVVPEYRAARFAALLAARLEATVLTGPVRRMEFSAGRLRRFVSRSNGLWAPGEHGGGTAQQAPEFLQTLLARLGEGAVYSLACVDEHRPERQQRSVWPSLAFEAGRAAPLLPMGDTSGTCGGAARPLGLFAEPQPLEVLRDESGQVRRLLYQERDLTLVSGPERLETGWWDGHEVTRDYYVACSSDGGRWWIFRECAAGRRWFVHGCFA